MPTRSSSSSSSRRKRMWRTWIHPRLVLQGRGIAHATGIALAKQTPPVVVNSESGNGGGGGVAAMSIAPGPYRTVGNIFIVHCDDHPFKHSWEVNRMLRELRLEYRGQTTIVPDIPQVRKCLWRVRHVVKIDVLDLDEARALIGVPEHINFSDLASQIPASFGRVRAVANPVLRSKMNFMKLRRLRLRDVLHRDALELRLLEERRKALTGETQQKEDQQQSFSTSVVQSKEKEASQSS